MFRRRNSGLSTLSAEEKDQFRRRNPGLSTRSAEEKDQFRRRNPGLGTRSAGEKDRQAASSAGVRGSTRQESTYAELVKAQERGEQFHRDAQYSKAEEAFRSAIKTREETRGAEHPDTLISKSWLGRSLYEQKRYNEAEQLFRKVAEQQEKVLGAEYRGTLGSKQWIGLSLYGQERYDEAEQLFREVAEQQKKVLGAEHRGTLGSKHWLGRSLYGQERYDEAEQLFREVAEQQEKVLGTEHEDTLYSKRWLGMSLYEQERYDEAEQLLRKVAEQQEKALGTEHRATLESKKWLGKALELASRRLSLVIESRRHPRRPEAPGTETQHPARLEAESVSPEPRTEPTDMAVSSLYTLKTGHVDTGTYTETPYVVRQEIHSSVTNEPQAPKTRLQAYFTPGAEHSSTYTDADIQQIVRLLAQIQPRWRSVPRTYIILRHIGCLDALDEFLDLGFSDYWFPVSKEKLPACLRPSQKELFIRMQKLVLTKSIDLEKGRAGSHQYFTRNDVFPFEFKGILGTGGFGQVDRVLSLNSFREYACKRTLRSKLIAGRSAEDVQKFIAEVEILKRLDHHHMVEFVGSYTDSRYMGIIMSPVAEMDLSRYLAQANDSKRGELCTFFGCITSSVEYLHSKNIRHKDIKPGNILVHGGNILLTDFGLSLDFSDAEGSTTMGMANGVTPRYCAPEVIDLEPRNTLSDIWSLGVVFLEMVTVLKGEPVSYIDNFLTTHGTKGQYVRTNPTGTNDLILDLRQKGKASDNVALSWVEDMLVRQHHARPTAAWLVGEILRTRSGAFCGICCADDDGLTNASD